MWEHGLKQSPCRDAPIRNGFIRHGAVFRVESCIEISRRHSTLISVACLSLRDGKHEFVKSCGSTFDTPVSEDKIIITRFSNI